MFIKVQLDTGHDSLSSENTLSLGLTGAFSVLVLLLRQSIYQVDLFFSFEFGFGGVSVYSDSPRHELDLRVVHLDSLTLTTPRPFLKR